MTKKSFLKQRRLWYGDENPSNDYVTVPTIISKREVESCLYVEKEILDGNVDSYEFPRVRLKLEHTIGIGAFGEVFLGKAMGIAGRTGFVNVAVKQLKEKAQPEELDDFLSEITIMKRIGIHPNIVAMYGCCTLKEPYMMIMELVPCGDLRNYLLDLRKKWRYRKLTFESNSSGTETTSNCCYIEPDGSTSKSTSARPSVTETEYTYLESEGTPSPTSTQFKNRIECVLDHTELQNFALQIAKGMEHLEKISITHRDLAARNILIDEYKTLKISDFGLSRTGPYVIHKLKKLPLRWMALEAIEDQFYDSKSDVWAFAVVLWEIGTLGAFPYKNVHDSMIVHYLLSGKRLQRPEICTDELYSLMLRCWSQDPNLRPSFQELVDLLDAKTRRIYVDFSQLNPTYVFPPAALEELSKNIIQNLPTVTQLES